MFFATTPHVTQSTPGSAGNNSPLPAAEESQIATEVAREAEAVRAATAAVVEEDWVGKADAEAKAAGRVVSIVRAGLSEQRE